MYYTPQYIVDYIVDNTIGKFVNDKTPNKVSELKILDPACGSGSFLLGAYKYLLKWHLHYYTSRKDRDRLTDKIYQFRPEEYRLTIREKKRILINNIYGVDIDPQAVEVTKLSLLLKVLEDESKDELEEQKTLFKERALPDLDSNIKCGNSLIGSEIFDEEIESIEKINFFDWNTGFSEIMENGGFDAIIGNPPYIRVQAMKEWSPIEVEFYKKKYVSASKGNYDIYVVFVERGLELLNENGILGYILPHKFFNAKYGQSLRSLIADGNNINKIVHFGDQQIFENATTYTNLLFLTKSENRNFKFIKVDDLNNWRHSGNAIEGKIALDKVSSNEWNFIVGKEGELFEKLKEMPITLKNVVNGMFVGQQTSADTVYLFKEFKESKEDLIEVFSKEQNKWVTIEVGILKDVVRSGSIKRFKANPTAFVLFPYNVENCKATLYTNDEMKKLYPLAWQYLMENKSLLENREKGKFKGSEWYRFGRNQNLGMWEQPKLMIPYMISELAAYLDLHDYYYFINVTTGGFGITSDETFGSMSYLCGLLNSRLLDFFIKKVSTTFRGGYFAANKQYIEKLPIRAIDFDNLEDVASHDKMVELVENMLKLNETLVTIKVPTEKEMIQRQIDAIDKQINRLVYKLYELSDEEILIVEDLLI